MPCLHRSARGGRGELVGVRDRSVHPSERSWPARPVRARPFRRDLPHPSNALCTLVLCACRSGWNALEDRSDRPRRRLCAAPSPPDAPRAAAAAPAPSSRPPHASQVLRIAPNRAHRGAQLGSNRGKNGRRSRRSRSGRRIEVALLAPDPRPARPTPAGPRPSCSPVPRALLPISPLCTSPSQVERARNRPPGRSETPEAAALLRWSSLLPPSAAPDPAPARPPARRRPREPNLTLTAPTLTKLGNSMHSVA